MAQALAGIRALVTRPAAQAEALCLAIRARGGTALALPLLRVEPVPPGSAGNALPSLGQAGIAIFVSANAVRHALAQLRAHAVAWPATLRCLAIGAATRAALAQAGIEAESGSGAMDSEELLACGALAAPAGTRVLLVRGEGGRELIAARLRERGAVVDEWVVYRRCPAGVDAATLARVLRENAVNVLLAANGETLELLLGLLGGVGAGTIPPDTPLVVPGARVAEIARRAGCTAVEVADNATDAATLAALARIAARTRPAVEH